MTYSFEPISVPSADDPPSTGGETAAPEVLEPAEFELADLSAHMPQATGPVDTRDAREREIEEMRSAAHMQGFEDGRKAEAQRMRSAVEAAHRAADSIRVADEQRAEEALDRIAALATAIAGHLIEREVRTSPEVISELVRVAVAEFPISDPLSIHLNPADLALLSSGLATDSSREQLTIGQSVRWIPDPSLHSGGCLVESEERVVDARLGEVLERIFHALVDV